MRRSQRRINLEHSLTEATWEEKFHESILLTPPFLRLPLHCPQPRLTAANAGPEPKASSRKRRQGRRKRMLWVLVAAAQSGPLALPPTSLSHTPRRPPELTFVHSHRRAPASEHDNIETSQPGAPPKFAPLPHRHPHCKPLHSEGRFVG